jgi:hypothetical protein
MVSIIFHSPPWSKKNSKKMLFSYNDSLFKIFVNYIIFYPPQGNFEKELLFSNLWLESHNLLSFPGSFCIRKREKTFYLNFLPDLSHCNNVTLKDILGFFSNDYIEVFYEPLLCSPSENHFFFDLIKFYRTFVNIEKSYKKVISKSLLQ